MVESWASDTRHVAAEQLKGVVVLPDGIRLQATSAHGRGCRINWAAVELVSPAPGPVGKTLKGSEYDTDQEWHLRNMQYGDGWAYDSTQSHYKRAKPTYTDPEDDKFQMGQTHRCP